MHKAEIDVVLVDYLRSYAQVKRLNRPVVEAALSLLLQITNYCASVLVVNKVVSLFCPVDSYYLPSYQDLLMETIREMVQSAAGRPAAPVPIQRDTEIPLLGLTGKLLLDSFSISFWIMVTTPMNGPYPIFILEESDLSKVAIHAKDGEIQV